MANKPHIKVEPKTKEQIQFLAKLFHMTEIELVKIIVQFVYDHKTIKGIEDSLVLKYTETLYERKKHD